MSAPNFSTRTNSNCIYAFCEDSDFRAYVDENAESWGIESDEDRENAYMDSSIYQDWYDDEKSYYLEWLEEELEKATRDGSGLHLDFNDSSRISDGDDVAEIYKCFYFGGTKFTVMASVVFNAGYYAGFALDWRVAKVEGENAWTTLEDELPDADGCRELLEDNTDLNAGLCKALASKLEKRIQDELATITEAIEKALATIAPYHLAGHILSNGEGFYVNLKSA